MKLCSVALPAMFQAPTTLCDRIELPTVTIDVPPAELFDWTPDAALLARTARIRSALTLPSPLIARTPLPLLRLLDVSGIAAVVVPLPRVPSRRIPPPVLLSI